MTSKTIYILCMVAMIYAAPQRQYLKEPPTQQSPLAYDLLGFDDFIEPDDSFGGNDLDGPINGMASDNLNEISNSQNLNSFASNKEKDKKTKKETPPEVVDEGDLFENETAAVLSDLCYAVKCDAGAMCVVTNNKTSCYCPTICQEEKKPVCSMYGKEYSSKCQLHKEACKLGKTIRIAYEGKCIAKQGLCVDMELIQFPIRFLEWMMHLRQHEKAGQIDKNSKLVDLTPHERLTVAEWMFHRLDLQKDFTLQQIDLRDILLYLLPVEHCIDEFLTSCDADKNEDISIFEWKKCLLPGTNTVENSFFDLNLNK